MNDKKWNVDGALFAGALFGSLILLNVVGQGLFARLDLTKDKMFTLSRGTLETLKALKDPITVKAYFTAEMPPPYSQNARYVHDLLEELYAHSGGNLRYEFVDPYGSESEADKEKRKDVKHDIFGRAMREQTSIERELQSLGIQPVQVQINQADKVEVARVYMGLSLRYGDKKEVIPVVQKTDGLEYDLTTILRKLTRERVPRVALVEGHQGPDTKKGLTRFYGLLSPQYGITTVDLTKKAEIAEDIDALVVAGPKTPLGDAEVKAIDKFVMSGKPAAFLLDAVSVDISRAESEDAKHGLGALLESYGVKVGTSLVMDVNSAQINVTQQQGMMQIMQTVPYPFMPLPKALDDKHPLTRGMHGVSFPFTSPLEVVQGGQGAGAKAEVLIKSSERSWTQKPPFNVNPLQAWTSKDIKIEGPKNLVVALSGPLKSPYGQGASAAASPDEPEGKAQSEGPKNGRVLVAGGSSFIQDSYVNPSNQAFMLNLVDWLLLDEALLSIRTRGLAEAPLDETSDGARGAIKYANIIGLPSAFVLFGVVRWRLRERRRGWTA